MKQVRALVPLALVGALAACADGPAEPESPQELDESALLTLFGAASAGPAGTRACPAGGEIVAEVEADTSIEGDIATATFEAIFEHRDCAYIIDGDRAISDGVMQYEGHQRSRLREGAAPELLESMVHQTGTMHIRYRDYDRTCSMDVTQTLDVARNEIRLTGTMCGRAIDIAGPRIHLAS